MITEKVFDGNPYAGNPYARFEEGASAIRIARIRI